MTVKNGIKILLTDKEKNQNKDTIEFLTKIKNEMPNELIYRKELFKNTIQTLEEIEKQNYIDF